MSSDLLRGLVLSVESMDLNLKSLIVQKLSTMLFKLGVDLVNRTFPTHGVWAQKIRHATTGSYFGSPSVKQMARWYHYDRMDKSTDIQRAMSNGRAQLFHGYYHTDIAKLTAMVPAPDKPEFRTWIRDLNQLNPTRVDLPFFLDTPDCTIRDRILLLWKKSKGQADLQNELAHQRAVHQEFRHMCLEKELYRIQINNRSIEEILEEILLILRKHPVRPKDLIAPIKPQPLLPPMELENKSIKSDSIP